MINTVKKSLDYNKQERGKGLPLDLVRVAKFCDSKVFDQTQLKILAA